MNKLHIGIIGLGVGSQHVLSYRNIPSCEIAAICDYDAEKLKLAKNNYPSSRITENANEILTDSGIDSVSIASYDNDHAQQVLMALKGGKHVFVEKPLCQTIDQLKQIKTAWDEHNGKLKLSCNFVLRMAPLYQWLKSQISNGKFGDIYAFDGEYCYGRLHKITEDWRKDVKDYSVMQGGGIHLIDLMLWLTNQRPHVISAFGNHICTSGTAFQYNDYVTATMQAQSGLISRITANFGCVHRHQHVLRIFGTKATFIHDDQGPRIHRSRDPGHICEQINLAPVPETKGELIPPFVSSIINNDHGPDDTQLIFDTMSISTACDKAVQTGEQESINYL